MNGSQEEFEDRIRRALDQAARQLQVRPVAWQGPLPAQRRLARPDLGSVVALAAVLVALLIGAGALVVLGRQQRHHGVSPSGNPLPPAPAAAFEPHLSRTESHYIVAAWRATTARDHSCRPAGPELTTGSADRGLTSRFAILRGSPTRADRLRALLHNKSAYGPLATVGNFNQEIYLNQIHLARTAFGARFYVIPAGNVTGQRGVPARCGPEQVAALHHQVAHLPRPQRTRILAAQRRYLADVRYLALHPEGICATFVPSGARQLDLADNLGCATLADFGRWGVLADADALLPHAAVFWTVVPDGVAQVTWQFAASTGGLTHAVSITNRPVNNIAIARAPYHAPNESGFPSTIVLLGWDGHVIKKTTVTPNMITLCGYGC